MATTDDPCTHIVTLVWCIVVCKMTHAQPLQSAFFDHRQMVELNPVELRGSGGVRRFRWRLVCQFRGRPKVSCWDTNHLCNLIILRRTPVFVDLVRAPLWYYCCRGYLGHVFQDSQTATRDEQVHKSDESCLVSVMSGVLLIVGLIFEILHLFSCNTCFKKATPMSLLLWDDVLSF